MHIAMKLALLFVPISFAVVATAQIDDPLIEDRTDCSGREACLAFQDRPPCEEATGQLICLLRTGCSWQRNTAQCVGEIPTCKSVENEIDCNVNMKGCTWVEDPTCLSDTFHQAIEPIAKDLKITQPSSNNTVVTKTKLVSTDGKVSFWGFIDVPRSVSACTMSINDQECQSCEFCIPLQTATYDCTNLIVAGDVDDPECPGGQGMRCVGQDCSGKCICKQVTGTGVASSSSVQEPFRPRRTIYFSIAAGAILLGNGLLA